MPSSSPAGRPTSATRKATTTRSRGPSQITRSHHAAPPEPDRHLARRAFPEAPLPAIRLPALLRSEEHTSELQSRLHLVCRLLLEKKKKIIFRFFFLKKKNKKKYN